MTYFTRALLRLRMLDRLGDLWMESVTAPRPTSAEYLDGATFRHTVGWPTLTAFGAQCWVCGITAREAEYRHDRLTTAHIVYPSEPYGEIIDPDNLTRSDVVLLCWPDHQLFNSLTDEASVSSIDELREVSRTALDRMRVPGVSEALRRPQHRNTATPTATRRCGGSERRMRSRRPHRIGAAPRISHRET